jgi:hypothetical protein
VAATKRGLRTMKGMSGKVVPGLLKEFSSTTVTFFQMI